MQSDVVTSTPLLSRASLSEDTSTTATTTSTTNSSPRLSWSTSNLNVKIICLCSLLFHMGWSIWERNLFPVWIVKQIEQQQHHHSGNTTTNTTNIDPQDATELVGFIQSTQGLVALFVGPLVGTIMDWTTTISGLSKFRYFFVIEGLCTLVALSASIYYEQTGWALYVSIAMWGLLLAGQGVFIETLLARSTTPGDERTYAVRFKFIIFD